MPMTKQASMVARRMKISIVLPSPALLECCGGMFGTRRPWRRSDSEPFENKQQEDRTADRDRQGGYANRQRGKIRDRILPGCRDELDAPIDHEQRDQGH